VGRTGFRFRPTFRSGAPAFFFSLSRAATVSLFFFPAGKKKREMGAGI
jgi:hypothetical protein